jgi:predicted nucleic acid-binding protein
MTTSAKVIVDTNVVSEMMQPQTHRAVLEWLDSVEVEALHLTATSLAELRVGLAVMPLGKRRAFLSAALDRVMEVFFSGRILAFDREAAERFGEIVSRARTRGRAIAMADGQIAAIAHVHGFSVATRDTSPFLAAGVAVVDPWKG